VFLQPALPCWSFPRSTNFPAIANPPLPAEGSASFSNYQLAAANLLAAWLVQRLIPFKTGWTTYFVILAIIFVPVTIAYWTFSSKFGRRLNEKVPLPNKPQETYFEIKSTTLDKYRGKKIPMQVFHDAYVLDVMEYRHDWASFEFTPAVSGLVCPVYLVFLLRNNSQRSNAPVVQNHTPWPLRGVPRWLSQLFKYVFFNLIPDVVIHSQSQDEEQVRDHYDRGDDFYSWFLGPRMIYTSGVIKDINRMETLEELQDNKLTMVCEKLDLKPGDRLLDIGCGWGTLATFAAKNYGADATGGMCCAT
jgi:hypothetical protein